MRRRIGLEEESALAADALVTTDSGLMYMSDIAGEGMGAGDVRAIDLNLISPDGGIVHADRIVCCGNRTAYTVRLKNGMRSTTTYANQIDTGTSDDGVGLTRIENLSRHDIVKVPLVPHIPYGKYDGRLDWDARMNVDGSMPYGVLCGKREYVDLLIRSMFESRYSITDVAPRTTVSVSGDNDVSLIYHGFSKRSLDQIQMLLLTYYGVVSDCDYDTCIMRIDNEFLARLDRKLKIVEDVCEDNDISYSDVRWLLDVCGKCPSDATYVEIAKIESNGRRDMYNFVLPESATFMANGTVHTGTRQDYEVTE